MYIFANILIIIVLTVEFVITSDVCSSSRCQCSEHNTLVNCDKKGWMNLDDIDFPLETATLTLVQNRLKFDTVTDRRKIDNLTNLINLSLNQNPLGLIPPFNNTKILFLSLRDASITSAEFPSSYTRSSLQTISLSNNKIRTIDSTNFVVLGDSKLTKLHIDSASISTIDQNAFIPLNKLQALSLKNNQLKSCEFLSNIPLLSSIHLDGNQFTSLPQQLAIPNKIKMYSFTQNLIKIIDERSPFNNWANMNYTDIKVYLANNSFDCCASLWFIWFLKRSSQYIGDASLLTCATPSIFAGKFLKDLNPDEMNCGGDIPSQSWWTIGRIIGIVVGCISAISIGILVIIVVFLWNRRRPSRSGYREIDSTDDPYENIDSASTGGPPFSNTEEDTDALPPHTHTNDLPNTAQSEAPTYSTAEGIPPADRSQAGGSEIDREIRLL